MFHWGKLDELCCPSPVIPNPAYSTSRTTLPSSTAMASLQKGTLPFLLVFALAFLPFLMRQTLPTSLHCTGRGTRRYGRMLSSR